MITKAVLLKTGIVCVQKKQKNGSVRISVIDRRNKSKFSKLFYKLIGILFVQLN